MDSQKTERDLDNWETLSHAIGIELNNSQSPEQKVVSETIRLLKETNMSAIWNPIDQVARFKAYLSPKLNMFSQSTKIQKLKAIFVSSNVLHLSTMINPLRFYLLAFGMGVGLLIFSIAIGVASFKVDLNIETINNDHIPRVLDLGYLSQANYGFWYLALCPILLAIIAHAYDAMRKAHRIYPTMLPSLEQLSKTWWIALLGIFILCFFVFKNIYVEWGDYKNLGLGWVQAKTLQDYRSEIENTKLPIDLTAKGKKFDRFLIPKEERFIQKEEIHSVKLTKIDPQLNVKGLCGLIAFIIITKLWVGLWEAIVIYFAILTFTWGIKGGQNIDLPALKDTTGAFYHLSWIRRPALYIFLVGLLVNAFCILRYIGNAVKGSYGKWDQYWSFLTFSPALFLIPLFNILSIVFNTTDNEKQIYFSKWIIAVAGLWAISFCYVIYLLVGYINPQQQIIIVACLKPFIDIFKKLLGI